VVRASALSSSCVAAPSSSRVSESAQGLVGPGKDWVGLLWAWKAKLECLKGEVERALQCVFEGLDLVGPGKVWDSDFLKSNPKSLPKPKYKPRSKKGVKVRPLSLLRKPKPISRRLDLVRVPRSIRKPKTHFSKVGSSSSNCSIDSPEVSLFPDASPEVFLFSDALPEEVILPTPESNAVRQVGFGSVCPGEAGGSFALLPRPEDLSATTKSFPGQCSAPKPLKFYNRKSKASRFSNMDDNLIAEVVSAISDQHGVSRLVGAASSPLSGGSQTSSEVVLVSANNVPLTRGLLRRGFLKPSSSVVMRDCSPEPVLLPPEAMGCPQVSVVVQPPPTDPVVLDQQVFETVQRAMEIAPILGISCGGDVNQLRGLLTDLDKSHCHEISATCSKNGAKGKRELKNLDCSNIFEGSSRSIGNKALSVF
jgi:hypothetical protein